jgi:hypothetical protein
MVRVTPKAGAVFLSEDSPGSPVEIGCLPSVIGGPCGAEPTGLALKLDAESDSFRLILLDESNATLLALGPYPEEEAVAEWRSLAAASGLTLKIQLTNGSVMTPYPQIGRVQVGPVRIRRRHGLLNHRRPRFLTRRKTGRFPARPQVHREVEMADGEAF